jgi:hypothetical protein
LFITSSLCFSFFRNSFEFPNFRCIFNFSISFNVLQVNVRTSRTLTLKRLYTLKGLCG